MAGNVELGKEREPGKPKLHEASKEDVYQEGDMLRNMVHISKKKGIEQPTGEERRAPACGKTKKMTHNDYLVVPSLINWRGRLLTTKDEAHILERKGKKTTCDSQAKGLRRF